MNDTISRQDAIDAIRNRVEKSEVGESVDHDQVIADIELFPSAEPKIKCIAQIRIDRDDIEDLINEKVSEIVDKMAEPRTGEWLLEEQKSHNHIENFYICSSCRNFEAWGETELYNFCPDCGARMRVRRRHD